MKRKIEDDEETDHRRKLTTSAFQQYLQSRNRDNTAAIREDNPERYVNAVYEISFHLNLSQNIREKGTEIFHAIRLAKPSVPDIPTLLIQASACIWLAQKLQGNSNYRISTLLNIYPKLTTSIRAKRHQLYEPEFLNNVFHIFRTTFESLEATASIGIPILEHTINAYNHYRSSYEFYDSMFKLLFKFDDAQHRNFSDIDLSNSPILELMEFGWMLVMYFTWDNIGQSNAEEVNRPIIIWLLMFIGTQVEAENIRTIKEVALLSHAKGIFLELENIPADSLWTSGIALVSSILAKGFDISIFLLESSINQFLGKLQTMKLRALFSFRGDEIIPGCPWKLHIGAFDGTADGFLRTNMQKMTLEIDSHNKRDRAELDFLAFVPTWDKAIATPKHFSKTPVVRPMCRLSSHGSGINRAMQATPFTAKELLGPSERLSDTSTVRKDIIDVVNRLFENYIPPNDTNMPEIVSTRAKGIIAKAVTKLGENSKGMWHLAEKIYYSFMFQMVTLTDPKFENQVIIINDGQFHRATMCIAMEIVRFSSNFKVIGFEGILRMVDVNIVDLGLVLKIIIDKFVKIPTWPREIVKMLVSIFERIVESDIWNDSAFHAFLRQASSDEPDGTSPEQNTKVPISQVVGLFSKLMPDCLKTCSILPKKYVKNQPRTLIGYIFLYNEAATLARRRLINYFGETSHRLATTQELAWKFLYTCIKYEHDIKLIANRSIDVLILCSLFLAFRAEQGIDDSKWKELIAIYQNHPHYLNSSISGIFMGIDKSPVSIKEFYNTTFVTAIEPLLANLQSATTALIENKMNVRMIYKFAQISTRSPCGSPSTYLNPGSKLKKKLFASRPQLIAPGSPLSKPPIPRF